ncbi:TPA: hypothetical protein ACIVB1_001475 [Salmonella enterica subsp. diarizonae serovar 61:l,v:z35]
MAGPAYSGTGVHGFFTALATYSGGECFSGQASQDGLFVPEQHPGRKLLCVGARGHLRGTATEVAASEAQIPDVCVENDTGVL